MEQIFLGPSIVEIGSWDIQSVKHSLGTVLLMSNFMMSFFYFWVTTESAHGKPRSRVLVCKKYERGKSGIGGTRIRDLMP